MPQQETAEELPLLDDAAYTLVTSTAAARMENPGAKMRTFSKLAEKDKIQPQKIRSSVAFDNVMDGVSLLYQNYGYNVKESIIIEKPQEQYAYSFVLNLQGLTPTLEADGSVLLRGADGEPEEPGLSSLSLEGIWEFAHEVDVEDIREMVERQVELNGAISDEGLSGDWGARIGKTLLLTRPDDISCRARAAAAAGSDARMSGCAMPVVINCGSGNQGITCSLPVAEYARYLRVPHDEMLRAVALSDLTAIHAKRFIGELSAFCGAVTAATGAGAAVCYLRGGSFGQYQATIANTLANVGGIVCDGAKPSCAAKIAAAVDAAILGCDMALANVDFRPGEGLIGETAEETIRSMGYVGRVGMHPTDVEILNIMIGKTICS